MTLGKLRNQVPAINGWLLAAICFALPTHVAPVYILSAFVLGLWLLQSALVQRLLAIFRVPVNWAFISYYTVFLISMLWTEDTEWGWRMVGRQIPFLLFPLFWSVAQGANQRRCISAFIAGIAMSVVLAHYNWLQLHVFATWPEGIRVDKSPGDIAPFVDRIMYAPILAFGLYFVGYRLLFERPLVMWHVAYFTLFFAGVVSLLLSGGRAGMVGFFALLVTLIVQRLSHHPFRAVMLALLVSATILGVGYSTSSHLKGRVDSAIAQAENPAKNINSSVGLRINFVANSSRLFLENPLLGVGAGDFPAEYKAVNDRVTPQAKSTTNPHNQILWVLSTTGLMGGAALSAILLLTLISKWRLQGEAKHYLIAIWIGFGAISQFESYLWRSNTALLFCVLTAVIMASSDKLSASKLSDNSSPGLPQSM